MRCAPFFLLLIVLTACSLTQPYTQQDLLQVRQGYTTIRPIYIAFRDAYKHKDIAGIRAAFKREQKACRLVDQIDQRDSIDPNIDLFAASAGLDGWCDDIEGVYAYWAKKHHFKYDKSIPVSLPSDAFKDGNKNLKYIPKYLRRPKSYPS